MRRPDHHRCVITTRRKFVRLTHTVSRDGGPEWFVVESSFLALHHITCPKHDRSSVDHWGPFVGRASCVTSSTMSSRLFRFTSRLVGAAFGPGMVNTHCARATDCPQRLVFNAALPNSFAPA